MILDIIMYDSFDGIKYGFFGWFGGVLFGVFVGLNCGIGSSDQQDIVNINCVCVVDVMGVDCDVLVVVYQVYLVDVVVIIEFI